MGRLNFAAEMTSLTEACFRDIAAALDGDRVAPDGCFTDRGAVLATLRFIKAKTIEAEILLRAQRSGLDRWPLLDGSVFSRGDSSTRAPGYPPGDGGIESAPRSIPSGEER